MRIVLVIFGFLITTNAFTQKFFYEDSKYESDSLIVEVKDAIINLKQDFYKCRISITNKTNNHIDYQSTESILIINDKNFSCNNLSDMPVPAKTTKVSRTIQIDNINDRISYSDLNKRCWFTVNGIHEKKELIEIKPDSIVFGGEPEEYLYGSLSVKSGEFVKKTREAWQVFTVTNKGNATAVVDLSKVKIQTGEYVDDPTGNKHIYFLKPSEKVDIKIKPSIPKGIADMQTALIYIKWEDCFYELIFSENYIPDLDIPLNLERVKD